MGDGKGRDGVLLWMLFLAGMSWFVESVGALGSAFGFRGLGFWMGDYFVFPKENVNSRSIIVVSKE